MAEAIISTILKEITTIISEEALKKVRLLKDVKDDMRKLKSNLTAVKFLLEDAEEKQISDKAVKYWLDRLKEESLDMEDALDEWRTVLLCQSTGGSENASFLRRKVNLFFRCFSFHARIFRYHGIACNIKEISGRLDEIAQEKDRYQLVSRPTIRLPRRGESKSFTDESSLVGRDEVKDEIIHYLLTETSREGGGSSPVQTISIVGMGGIGKTALAQLVYNDENVKQHFTSRIWTCVSDIFDESKVAKAIIVALEGLEKQAILQLESVSLNALLERICKSIAGKKYLLILDDVWTEKDEDFAGLNVTFKHGASGSRILVTTRKETVARIMGSSRTIHVEELSQKACWSILRQKALKGRDQKTCEDLEPIGLRIAEKCKGLPLVAKTLGGLLQFKTTKQEWKKVLNSELWRMDVVEKDVFVPLLLSYYDLPSPIRQCFMYCAIFPKDTRIFTCHLIAHWRAQGYLDSDDGDDSSLDLKGFEYLKCLEARSFFQDFHFQAHHVTCKMHDLVHDFALFLTNGAFMIEEVSKGYKGFKMESSEKSCRHLSVMVGKGMCFPETISNAEKLRSLISYGDDAVISKKALHNLFNQANRLRLFEMRMRGYHDSTIPDEIGNLSHLRYLNLQHSRQLQRLPKALCRLLNLQFLDLCDCYNLQSLPDEIANLVNLNFLRTSSCSCLTCYPKGVNRLTRLTQLLGLVVRVDCDDPEKFSIGDLANLKQLLVLTMIMVGNTINMEESKKVKLQNLQEVEITVPVAMADSEDAILESLNMSSVPRYSFETNNSSSSRDECHYYGF